MLYVVAELRAPMPVQTIFLFVVSVAYSTTHRAYLLGKEGKLCV